MICYHFFYLSPFRNSLNNFLCQLLGTVWLVEQFLFINPTGKGLPSLFSDLLFAWLFNFISKTKIQNSTEKRETTKQKLNKTKKCILKNIHIYCPPQLNIEIHFNNNHFLPCKADLQFISFYSSICQANLTYHLFTFLKKG